MTDVVFVCCSKDIRQLDFLALREAGYRGAVFDKDNCLVRAWLSPNRYMFDLQVDGTVQRLAGPATRGPSHRRRMQRFADALHDRMPGKNADRSLVRATSSS